MKSILPMLLALGLGGVLISLGSETKQNPEETDEIPDTLDYNDPALASALDETEGDDDELDE